MREAVLKHGAQKQSVLLKYHKFYYNYFTTNTTTTDTTLANTITSSILTDINTKITPTTRSTKYTNITTSSNTTTDYYYYYLKSQTLPDVDMVNRSVRAVSDGAAEPN